MTRATILHEAEKELWEAVAWYEERCLGLGLDLERDVKAAVHAIEADPHRWPLRDDGTRRLVLPRFPYLIVYTIERDRLWILAFAHSKRRPRYWAKRSR